MKQEKKVRGHPGLVIGEALYFLGGHDVLHAEINAVSAAGHQDAVDVLPCTALLVCDVKTVAECHDWLFHHGTPSTEILRSSWSDWESNQGPFSCELTVLFYIDYKIYQGGNKFESFVPSPSKPNDVNIFNINIVWLRGRGSICVCPATKATTTDMKPTVPHTALKGEIKSLRVLLIEMFTVSCVNSLETWKTRPLCWDIILAMTFEKRR